MLLFPSTNHSDVLQQFKAGCTLGILIGDIMMKGGYDWRSSMHQSCQKQRLCLLIKNTKRRKEMIGVHGLPKTQHINLKGL